MAELTLSLRDGTMLVVPASLDSITTYVILEQEAWFEKETEFLLRWLRPGMTAIDIGASLGVYGLPMARLVAPHGRVFAYEPASEPRALLERSRVLNQANNLLLLAAALSDRPREGRLILGASSESSSLGGSGPGESVPITSLDLEDGTRGWASVDFVKIDAEGEEERILSGGATFFERHSPLVLFERNAGNVISENLRYAFPARGYRVYRLLTGAPVLVPDEPRNPIDNYELNLFAAKPDRAAALAREGLLLEAVPDWAPDEPARRRAFELLRAQAFAPAFAGLFANERAVDAEYQNGLAGYATWRSPGLPLSERCAALDFACRALRGACDRAATPSRLSTLARATGDAGRHAASVNTLKTLVDLAGRGEMHINEPFWPAGPRFDALDPGANWAAWFVVSALEQFERTSSFSSRFGRSGIDLEWLARQPFASIEIERRSVLERAHAGQRVEVPERLRVAAADHINADTWRRGLVPNTWIREASGSIDRHIY